MNTKRNFLITIRHLKAEKTNSVISILGLVLGLSVAAVVVVFLINELNYNSYFVQRDRIYRVLNYNDADDQIWANTPFVLGTTISNTIPEVEKSTHQYNIYDYEVRKGDEFIGETSMLCTDKSFFDIFNVRLIEGSANDMDENVQGIFMSRSLVGKYFGDESPLGKPLVLRIASEEIPVSVVGVYEDIPQNSTIRATMIANSEFGLRHLARVVISNNTMKLSEVDFRESWSYGQFFTNYVLLKKGTSPASLSARLKELGTEHSDEVNSLSFSLQPLSDVYFGSGEMTDNNSGDRGNKPMVLVLAFTGLIILLVACVNYINLTSAQTLSLTKTLAVRKVCGASRGDLIGQIVFESVFTSMLSLPFAILLADPLLPFISRMLGKQYTMAFNNQILLSALLLVIVAVISGAFSGLFVSLKITSFNLINTLKGEIGAAGKKLSIRKVMLVFQMSVFIILIAMVIMVRKQVHYALTKDMGFAREGLIRVPLGDHDYELFKKELSRIPDVLSVSGAMWMPPHNNHMTISLPRIDDRTQITAVQGLFVDYGFATTMGIRVVEGDDFIESKSSAGVLVNELAVEALGLREGIGEMTPLGPVVGIIDNFNMYSLHEKVGPLIIGLNTSMCRDIAVRIQTDNIAATIETLKTIWSETGGTTLFEFEFTDDRLAELYESDTRFSKTIGFLALLAVLIASMGLFGLSLLSGRQKTKEIGIRKVNGATAAEIALMVNRDYFICFIIAFVAAVPVAWFAMDKWLVSFAYRTTISWWIFALAGTAALIIAILSVSYQSLRAAMRNPVEALRYE